MSTDTPRCDSMMTVTSYLPMNAVVLRIEAARTLERELTQLRAGVERLLEQVDSLDGVEFSRDLPVHESEAVWDDVLSELRKLLDGDEHNALMKKGGV